MISLLVPSDDSAANIPSSGDQHIDTNALSAGGILVVQVIPSGLDMIRFVPSDATATNNPNSGDQVTELQLFASFADVLEVQMKPSGLVIT